MYTTDAQGTQFSEQVAEHDNGIGMLTALMVSGDVFRLRNERLKILELCREIVIDPAWFEEQRRKVDEWTNQELARRADELTRKLASADRNDGSSNESGNKEYEQ